MPVNPTSLYLLRVLTLKAELLYMQDFSSMKEFQQALIEYLNYYNNYRIKANLNGLSPVQYRIQTVQVA
ncbi:IS3 family transposase [Caproicibacterium sp. NSD3]